MFWNMCYSPSFAPFQDFVASLACNNVLTLLQVEYLYVYIPIPHLCSNQAKSGVSIICWLHVTGFRLFFYSDMSIEFKTRHSYVASIMLATSVWILHFKWNKTSETSNVTKFWLILLDHFTYVRIGPQELLNKCPMILNCLMLNLELPSLNAFCTPISPILEWYKMYQG